MAYRRHRKSQRGMRKTFLKKTFNKSLGMVKSTSQKVMPKVKGGLENVGSKVIKTGTETVPYLQSLTRKLFSMTPMTRKRRSKRRH